jgi:hypothetical protein
VGGPPGSLDAPARPRKAGRAEGMAAEAAAVACRPAAPDRRPGLRRPGLLGPLAVSTDRAPGRASAAAPQSPRPLPSQGTERRSALLGPGGGVGTACTPQDCPLDSTGLACWQEGCQDPGRLLTDLPPEAGDACGYGLRAWIEQSFQLLQRAGWQWPKTRRSAPKRAERLWLCGAGAPYGCARSEARPMRPLWRGRSRPCPCGLGARSGTRLGWVSVFRQGWVGLITALRTQPAFPAGRFLPEPWPQSVAGATAAQPPPKTLQQRAA